METREDFINKIETVMEYGLAWTFSSLPSKPPKSPMQERAESEFERLKEKIHGKTEKATD